jgi:hypothetical protein
VRGLVINRFAAAGIAIDASSNFNRVEGCFLGTNAAGTAKAPGAQSYGIDISGANNTIGSTLGSERNLISGHAVSGVIIRNVTTANFNRVQGNYIGTDLQGNADLGNTLYGVDIGGSVSNVASNIVSGNDSGGIAIQSTPGALTGGNSVSNNDIGTNAAGTAVIPNSNVGILVTSADNRVQGNSVRATGGTGGNGILVSSTRATINIISSNQLAGEHEFSYRVLFQLPNQRFGQRRPFLSRHHRRNDQRERQHRDVYLHG